MWFMFSNSGSKHLAGMLADVQADHGIPFAMHSAFPAEK